jgi:hypothetical protein
VQTSAHDPWIYLRGLPSAEPAEDLLFRIFAERRRLQRRQRRVRRFSLAAAILVGLGVFWLVPQTPSGDELASAETPVAATREEPMRRAAFGASAVEQAIEDAHRNGASSAEIIRLQTLQRTLETTAADGSRRRLVTLI